MWEVFAKTCFLLVLLSNKQKSYIWLVTRPILLKTVVSQIILFNLEKESYVHQGCIYLFKNRIKMATYMVK